MECGKVRCDRDREQARPKIDTSKAPRKKQKYFYKFFPFNFKYTVCLLKLQNAKRCETKNGHARPRIKTSDAPYEKSITFFTNPSPITKICKTDFGVFA